MTSPEQSDAGSYRERLLPRWWVWLVSVAFAAMLGIAYGAALGETPGWVVGVCCLVLVAWLLWVTSPVIAVTTTHLEVAGARLPRGSVADAECVDGPGISALRGPGADARLFVALRPWSARGGVLVRLADAEDPHPAWLFSSRHPARVRDALTGTMSKHEH